MEALEELQYNVEGGINHKEEFADPGVIEAP